MSTLAEMLGEQVRAQLMEAVAAKEVQREVEPAQPAKPKHERTCSCTKRNDGFRRDGDVFVHVGCGYPRPQVSVLKGANAQPVTAECSGCDRQVTVAARKDTPSASLLAGERLVVCDDCAKAMTAGKAGSIVSRPPTRAQRTEDGRQPVAVQVSKPNQPSQPTTKEPTITQPRINLDDLSDQELGAITRRSMKESALGDLIERVAKANHAAIEHEIERDAGRVEQRAERDTMGTLPGFTYKGVEVPALDVTSIDGLDEVPDRKVRSPYNKVRSRLGEGTLPTSDEPGVEACTWRLLVTEHLRLSALSESEPEPKAVVEAPVDPDEQARIDAIVAATGVTAERARVILARF